MFYVLSYIFQNKIIRGNDQLCQILISQVMWGLRLDHWVKQNGDYGWK